MAPHPFDHPEAAQRLASRRLQRKTGPKERSLPYDACQRSSAGQEKHRSEEEDRFESRKGPASAHVDNSGSSPPSETDIHGFLSIYDGKPFFNHLWITREAASVGCHAGRQGARQSGRPWPLMRYPRQSPVAAALCVNSHNLPGRDVLSLRSSSPRPAPTTRGAMAPVRLNLRIKWLGGPGLGP